MLRVKIRRALGEVSHTYQLAADETYIPADMNGAGGWRLAAEEFAYLNQDAYIAGDFYITARPVVPGAGTAEFQTAAAPRIEAGQETRRGPKEAPSDTRMTVWIYKPSGSSFRHCYPEHQWTVGARPAGVLNVPASFSIMQGSRQ